MRSVKKFNAEKELYNSLMESIAPSIKKAMQECGDVEAEDECDKSDKDTEEDDIEESALNELFGFGGSSVKKPEKVLSLENSDDENAELFIAWCGYFMSQASNNVKKGLEAFFKQFGTILVKSPMMITKGILKLLSGAIRYSVYGVAGVGAIILGGISALVRLTVSAAEGAKDALSQLYSTVTKGLQTFYKNFVNGAEKFSTDSQDKLTLWLGVTAGALAACASKIQGAGEAFGAFFKQVLADAKEKKDGAVLLVKTWYSAKSAEVKNYISETAGDIKKTVVEAWNSLDKKVRKVYNDVAAKLESWLNDFAELVSYASEKISDAAKAAKDFTIDTKDKALVWGIQKGVKGLSSKYTEDQVVALVRKCYNESLKPTVSGKYRINEVYFYSKNTRQRRLYETKMARRKKLLNS